MSDDESVSSNNTEIIADVTDVIQNLRDRQAFLVADGASSPSHPFFDEFMNNIERLRQYDRPRRPRQNLMRRIVNAVTRRAAPVNPN